MDKDYITYLAETMEKHGLKRVSINGIEIERFETKGLLRVPVYKSVDEKPKDKKDSKKEPSDEELLLNPYAGLEQ